MAEVPFHHVNAVLAEYMPAFSPEFASQPFVTYCSIAPDKSIVERHLTRGEFWKLGCKAATVLKRAGLKCGDCHTHFFSDNTLGDVAFRLASIMLGTTPVTVNWQADTDDRVVHKARVTASKIMIVDSGTPPEVLAKVKADIAGIEIFDVASLDTDGSITELPSSEFCTDTSITTDSPRIVIFTSGTTGNPKGVRLTYRSYKCNRATFEQFLHAGEGKSLTAVVTNPLHHTNSTSITDWALRKPGTRLHLIQRYSTQYWLTLALAGTPLTSGASADEIVAAVTKRNADPNSVLVAPLVSRHFDFLDSLASANGLPLPNEALKLALSGTILLVGSAPVGPTTVARLQQHANRLPVVRFGSTETCLQVMGTPLELNEEQRLGAFQAGWAHSYNGQETPGYYIGRPHPPFTACRIVKGVEPDKPGYLEECDEGQPGQLITKGDNLMSGYVGDEKATAKAMKDGWYTNLGDICFWLKNKADGGSDFFWCSRDSALLIRGGANYSYEQINAELQAYICKTYSLPTEAIEVAVVGLALASEHEDDCCVTVELVTDEAKAKQAEMEASFLKDSKKSVSKGAKPDRVRFAPLPRNFKGAIKLPDLKDEWKALAKAVNVN